MLPSMAAKEKTSWLTAWLAPILFLLAAGPASALTRGALQTRAWEKTSSPLESRQSESLQLLNLHQQNGSGGYDSTLGSPLAAENGGSGESHIPRSGSEWEAKFKSESGDANVQRMTKDVEPEGMHGVAAKGQAGEKAAGITQKKVAVQGPISGKTRFPDEITATTIKEVKNVAKQGWTAQLKDSAEIAKQTGKTFELWVRKSTVLSGPLQAAEKAGQVFINYLKGL